MPKSRQPNPLSFALKAKRKREEKASRLQAEATAAQHNLYIQQVLASKPKHPLDSKFDRLGSALCKAQKLLADKRYVEYLEFIEQDEDEFVRDPSKWEPKGKGRDTLFKSLCSHLYGLYRMPEFIWSAFMVPKNQHERRIESTLAKFARYVAKGGSAYDAVKSGILPVPLNRKMCHRLMSTVGDIDINQAIRRAQILTLGGDMRLVSAILKSRIGPISPGMESFWSEVISWFCSQPMLDPAQIGPIVDYVIFRFENDTHFSMKGRTPLALIRAVEEWHGDLAKAKIVHGKDFTPSGYVGATFDRSIRDRTGNMLKSIWYVNEILTSKALLDEGKAMKHCVYSYSTSIERGDCSIWTITEEDDKGHWRRLTVEVRKSKSTIVQARAVCNQQPRSQDLVVLRQWANQNNLEIRC